jgi:Squalene-hopene cyclase C-terminal domain
MRLQLAIVAAWLTTCAIIERSLATSPDSIRDAAVKSLTLLQKSAAEYTVHRKCFSCHHQALPVLAVTTAKTRGFEINDKELQRQLQFTADFLAKNSENYQNGKGQGGQADTAGYALLTLDAGGWKADATTAAVVDYLLLRDQERDHWRPVSQRPPSEASAFTTTYLALHGLKKYAPPDKQKVVDARIDKARKWLTATRPKDREDSVFRLLALNLADADAKAIESAAQELLKNQRPDGGWSQTDKLESDAYATGSALVALHQAGGLPTKDDVYQRGVEFLVKGQQADGSWHVRSRSKPFQTYFESGFPHGKDQFISSAASSWATIALTLACEPAKK